MSIHEKKNWPYEMDIHDVIENGPNMPSITRVPGGWIYTFFNHDDPDTPACCAFVPLTLEGKQP